MDIFVYSLPAQVASNAQEAIIEEWNPQFRITYSPVFFSVFVASVLILLFVIIVLIISRARRSAPAPVAEKVVEIPNHIAQSLHSQLATEVPEFVGLDRVKPVKNETKIEGKAISGGLQNQIQGLVKNISEKVLANESMKSASGISDLKEKVSDSPEQSAIENLFLRNEVKIEKMQYQGSEYLKLSLDEDLVLDQEDFKDLVKQAQDQDPTKN